jgi:hypothetical protein
MRYDAVDQNCYDAIIIALVLGLKYGMFFSVEP